MLASCFVASVTNSIDCELMSQVIQFLPKSCAAIAVVPEPAKGSKTHPSSGHEDLIILSNSLSGFCVGYFRLV
jgi:hypothetical protein